MDQLLNDQSTWKRYTIFQTFVRSLKSSEFLDPSMRFANSVNAWIALTVCKDLKDQVYGEREKMHLCRLICIAWFSTIAHLHANEDPSRFILMLPLADLWRNFSFYCDARDLLESSKKDSAAAAVGSICLRSYLLPDLINEGEWPVQTEIDYVHTLVEEWKQKNSQAVVKAENFRKLAAQS